MYSRFIWVPLRWIIVCLTLLLDGEILKTLIFYGDQLTVERARAGQKVRIASDTREEALDGLEPAASDWHAEANFLQV